MLIGAAPAAYDLLGAVMRNEDRRGVSRKLRNGLIGGTVGGLIGGVLSVYLHGLWAGVFPDADAKDLWSPSATGFVALGACIGLTVPLAQVILREAWLRVESGFRPGRQLLLTRPETTIGRAESCDLGLFGDAAVEKLHAKIIREGNRWMLTDAGTAGRHAAQRSADRRPDAAPLRRPDPGRRQRPVVRRADAGRPAAPQPARSPRRRDAAPRGPHDPVRLPQMQNRSASRGRPGRRRRRVSDLQDAAAGAASRRQPAAST